jgi:hypothetical protein
MSTYGPHRYIFVIHIGLRFFTSRPLAHFAAFFCATQRALTAATSLARPSGLSFRFFLATIGYTKFYNASVGMKNDIAPGHFRF